MNRSELTELHYITHINNLESIMRNGILSHNRAMKHGPTSVANPDIQGKRLNKRVPGGLTLHDYANLYFNARNAMLFRVLGFPNVVPSEHLNIFVLSVSPEVLDLPGVAISDRNAVATLSRFYSSPDGLQNLEKATIFAKYWKDPNPLDTNPIEEMRRKECMMAEILVPYQVGREYLQKIYACCSSAQHKAQAVELGMACIVHKYLFFNEGGHLHD